MWHALTSHLMAWQVTSCHLILCHATAYRVMLTASESVTRALAAWSHMWSEKKRYYKLKVGEGAELYCFPSQNWHYPDLFRGRGSGTTHLWLAREWEQQCRVECWVSRGLKGVTSVSVTDGMEERTHREGQKRKRKRRALQIDGRRGLDRKRR